VLVVVKRESENLVRREENNKVGGKKYFKQFINYYI